MTDWGVVAGTLAGTVLGWLGALVQSGTQQDRERLIRQRSVARALYSELGRIRASLGDREHGPEKGLVEANAGIPELYPLFRPLLPELAGTDGAICTEYLALERGLLWYKGTSRSNDNALAVNRLPKLPTFDI